MEEAQPGGVPWQSDRALRSIIHRRLQTPQRRSKVAEDQVKTEWFSAMAAFSIAITLAIRIVLVLLFFPFSALDKILSFHGALSQAKEAVSNRAVAAALVFAGLFLEIVVSLGILTGIADRLCAFIFSIRKHGNLRPLRSSYPADLI